MLSRLLRRVIFAEVLIGALLGGFIARQCGLAGPMALLVSLLVGLAIPPALIKLSIFTSCVRSRVPGTNGLWLRSFIGETLTSMRVYLLKQPWAKAHSEMRPALGLTRGVPVVLVHGYFCNHSVWDAMADRLCAAGHPVLAVDLEPLFTSIDDYAPIVEQAVQTLCRDTGAPQVALLGHSMGGLAIRAWMRVHGTERVARVITLGTPHAGTRIDPHPLTANSAQMVWQSVWLKELAAGETAQTRKLMRIALTPQDNIVYPQREQVLPDVPAMVFEGLGHLELCFNPAVMAWVAAQLDDLAAQ